MAVDLTISDSLAEIVLNRPDKLNAINEAMAKELVAAFERVERAAVRALLLRGEGAGFCAGRDLADAGLVNQSLPKEKLVEHARSIAAQVAKGPTAAFAESKRLMRRIDEEALGLFAVLRCEAQAQGAAGRTADYTAGTGAFQQKRGPRFVGR